MLCSDPKLDSHRYKDIIDEAIAEGEFYFRVPCEKSKHMIQEYLTGPYCS